MRHLILSLSILFASASASAGVVMLNCTSDWGLSFVVSTDVDEADLGTVYNYGTLTQFEDNFEDITRSTVELKGTYKIVQTSSGKIQKVILNHTGATPRAWEVVMKKSRSGLNSSQKVYEAAVTEKAPAAGGGLETLGRSNLVCLDSM